MKHAYLALCSVIFAACLSACTTVSRETAFAPSNTDAFVMIAAENVSPNSIDSYSFTFRRYNIETRTFERGLISIGFTAPGAMDGDSFRQPAGMVTALRFGGDAGPPGDYMLITRTNTRSLGYSISQIDECFSLGAPVYRIEAGKVNLIRIGPALSSRNEAPLDEQARQVLAGYPGITAPVAPAELLGVARFETTRWLGQQVCTSDGATDFTPSAAH